MTDKLALDGGDPAIPEHLIADDWERYRKATDEEVAAVSAVLRSGHLSIAMPKGMPQADALEAEFADWVGARHCIAVNSGTAALHCAVAGVGVKAGDQVILPADTFVASAMAVLHHNAIPVFADVDPYTSLIEPAQIEAKITEHTRAIMVVQLFGQCCDMDAINAIADRHGLKVIEDCAQAYGTEMDGRRAGTLGDAAGFAMTTTKQLMVGEGGLMTTDDRKTYEQACMTRLFGESGEMAAPDRAYLSEQIGWNYKLTEVNSALARVRLRHLDEYISGTIANADRLTRRLQAIPGVVPPITPDNAVHTAYIYSVVVDPTALDLDVEVGRLRNAAMRALAAENVDVMLWQKVPVPAQPMFQNKFGYGNRSPWDCPAGDVSYAVDQYPDTFTALDNSFAVRRIVSPNGPEQIDRIADAFEKVFSQIDRVLALYDTAETYVPLGERKAQLATGQL